MAPPPASFVELVNTGLYDVFGLTQAERDAGCTHSHHVLHLPGKNCTLELLPMTL